MSTPALRVLHLAGAAYLVTGVVGSWVSLRDDLVGELLGLRTPSAVPQHTALVGAYLAIPSVIAAAGLRALAAADAPRAAVSDRS